MRILIDIGHPAHVHMFKYLINELQNNGHQVIVTVKEIPSAKELLNKYGIKFISLGKKFDSIVFKGLSQFKFNLNLYNIAKKHKIDIAIGSSITITHVSRFYNMKSIIMDDDDNEAVRLFVKFAHPFAHYIFSPDSLAFQRIGKKYINYSGTHEMMYLHPKRFKPDSNCLNELGLSPQDRFFILRFVAVKAYHDAGQSGLDLNQKKIIIDKLKPYGKIFITSEQEIEPALQQYQINISSEKIHHLLHYATMYVGDSQTMTSEAAVLGTPALKCNTFAGRLSVPNELEEKYGLCYSYQPKEFNEFLRKLDELLALSDLKGEWRNRRKKLLSDKIDVTSFILWFIEKFPESKKIIEDTPDYQYYFK